MIPLNLNNRSTFPLRNIAQRGYVWTKAAWADAWTPRPDLYPTQTVWGTFPDRPSTASLHQKYGWTIQPGANRPTNYARITARGYWVLILFAGDDGKLLSWCGYAESPITESHSPATNTNPETGTQTIPCFGLERIWDYAYIDSTVATDPEHEGYHRRHIGTCPQFNVDLVGNRSADKGKLNDDRPFMAYAFAQPDAKDRTTWSSRDIVTHLLAYHAATPTRILPVTTSPAEIPWTITGLNAIPAWDAPTIYAEGSTVGEVLRTLIDPRRMNIGSIAPVVTTGGNSLATADPIVTAIQVTFATTLASPIVIPNVAMIPANPSQLTIAAIDDPHTSIDDTIDDADLVDQIVVRGPREIGIGTFSYGTELEADWSDEEKTEYDEGGKNEAGWAGMSNQERRELNASIREQPSLEKVYQWYKLVDDWDGMVGGERLYPIADPNSQKSSNKSGPLANHIPFAGSHEMLPDLPLQAFADYSGDVDTDTEQDAIRVFGSLRGRRNIVSLRHPTASATKRDSIHDIGEITIGLDPDAVQMQPIRIDDAPPPPRGSFGVRLSITGATRLVIAGDANIGNDADGTGLGVYDYETLQATIACLGDRRPAWAIPADSELESLDVVRRRVYTFDWPSLELVYIAKNTVVSIDETGDAIKSNGGVVRDPLPQLRAIAELIAMHSHRPRHRVLIRTSRRLGSTMPGTLLVGTDTVAGALDAPITEVRIDAPIGESGQSEISQTITAATYAADVLGLLQESRR